LFGAILAYLIRRFGSWAFVAAPFVWVFTEFLRYWIAGNDWNTIGYSQAFTAVTPTFAQVGGVLAVSFLCLALNISFYIILRDRKNVAVIAAAIGQILFLCAAWTAIIFAWFQSETMSSSTSAWLVAIQPNVPMSGLSEEQAKRLRLSQTMAAEKAIVDHSQLRWVGEAADLPTLVVLPESPMNYMWAEDEEFQQFIKDFTRKNNVSVLFNSAEPDPENRKYFNSAVMVDASGHEVAEYDKIYLLPFGEAVPVPLESIIPGFVGNFSYGRKYSLVPLGDAKAGIMICFESHFGQLAREEVRGGADLIIEMTNDGYLGSTPVLRQHLANAVFRAIETERPVLRVTNVGITAYITEWGKVLDTTQPYTEDTRVWSVERSYGHTFYVRYGDWFAWLCSAVTIVLLVVGFLKRINLSATA
jgi:apolipoprotein N-acyltransferase